MAQLIATNQLTLTNVIDGKSSYTHIAYAVNIIEGMETIPETAVTSSVTYPNPAPFGDSETVKNLIQVTAGQVLYLLKISPDYRHFRYNWYDSNMTFLSRAYSDAPKTKVIVPNNASYLWISIPSNANATILSNASFSMQGTGNDTHVGMYVDNIPTDSNDITKYNWTLSKGADGRTPYIHWAYSDNADGTGLTTSDNGQRYIGQYSDYTKADSTDKTKYRWADRWANIDVGGVNQISLTGALNGYRVGVQGENTPDSLHTVTKFIPVKYDNYVLSYDGELDSNPNYYYSLAWYSSPNINGFISRPTGPARQTDLLNGIKLTPPANATYLRVSFPTDFYKAMLNGGTVKLNWSQSPEDIQAELEKVVYKTDISVTDEGIVHSASKTVNGQTIASMIAQRAEWVEIIAKLLKVKGDMIVDGTIGANKLSVSTLSALTADLGQISGGSLELLKSEDQANSIDAWGNFTIPAHKAGLYIDNIGAISSGTPVRKSSSESIASDMPVAVLTSGQLRFARVDQNNDLGSVLHYGLSDPDNATISFAVASDGTKQLLIQANGQIVNQGTNYTGWNSTGVAGVYYKRQGDVVALKMQVNTTANQAYGLGKIPVELIPIPNNGTMMRVTAWTADQVFGRNLQIDPDGSMSLLPSSRGDTFNTQVTWII